jgi:hypothetical protein
MLQIKVVRRGGRIPWEEKRMLKLVQVFSYQYSEDNNKMGLSMRGATSLAPLYVFMAWCLVKHRTRLHGVVLS